jgi:hypothetical protein
MSVPKNRLLDFVWGGVHENGNEQNGETKAFCRCQLETITIKVGDTEGENQCHF